MAFSVILKAFGKTAVLRFLSAAANRILRLDDAVFLLCVLAIVIALLSAVMLVNLYGLDPISLCNLGEGTPQWCGSYLIALLTNP